MKNKQLTYVLILAVAGVWGLILYRVFDAASGDDDTEIAIPQTTKKEVYNDYQLKPDTTRLLLNYRDPFGLVKPEDTVRAVHSAMKTATIAAIPKPAVNWGFIKYSGFISNPGSKKMITVLTINGKNAMLAEGETSDDVKLLKNMRDSIKVQYKNKSKFIIRN